ncbi:hypothetical protein [Flavobacterium caseinilyticum]|uniref:hypothetical protein n=1 Tax=Flavobacterium caseinilyticum TaxID=2541732 RepID=UPI001404B483|nr:hypothetical protein [Flavobacterium caseinilyticum]
MRNYYVQNVNLQKITPMIGLLKEKSEIEKLKKEYQTLAEQNFNIERKHTEIVPEELVLEECES